MSCLHILRSSLDLFSSSAQQARCRRFLFEIELIVISRDELFVRLLFCIACLLVSRTWRETDTVPSVTVCRGVHWCRPPPASAALESILHSAGPQPAPVEAARHDTPCQHLGLQCQEPRVRLRHQHCITHYLSLTSLESPEFTTGISTQYGPFPLLALVPTNGSYNIKYELYCLQS